MRFEEILSNNISGSSAILQNFITFLKNQSLSPEFTTRKALAYIDEVIKSHPYMAVFIFLKNYMQENIEKPINVCLEDFQFLLNSMQEQTIEKAVDFLLKYKRILTISGSSVIEKVFLRLLSADRAFLILESRPMLEGVTLAEKLCKQFRDVNLFVDAAMGEAVRTSDIVVIGADIVTDDGVVNKIGSFPLALLANRLKRQICIIADTSKQVKGFVYDPKQDKHPEEEVYSGRGMIRIHNPYFEMVPWDSIDYWINEKEILKISMQRIP